MANRRNGIVTGYARMWPREIFDAKIGGEVIAGKLEFLREKGVYILYRDEHAYYIGKSSRSYMRDCVITQSSLLLAITTFGICSRLSRCPIRGAGMN